MTESMNSSTPQPPAPQQDLFSDECWTDETFTLLCAWEKRYMERGILSFKDWQEVADIVNAYHGHTEETGLLAVQCQNRIDALKKRYKIEKKKISDGGGTLKSSWTFFSILEQAISPNIIKQKHGKLTQSPTPLMPDQSTPSLSLKMPPLTEPLHDWEPPPAMLKSVVLPQTRPSTGVEEWDYTRKYSVPTAAAAAKDFVDGEEDKGISEEKEAEGREDKGVVPVERDEGLGRLANAIGRFVEVYEKVETVKQNQMVELEKQRMLFAQDFELKRLNFGA